MQSESDYMNDGTVSIGGAKRFWQTYKRKPHKRGHKTYKLNKRISTMMGGVTAKRPPPRVATPVKPATPPVKPPPPAKPPVKPHVKPPPPPVKPHVKPATPHVKPATPHAKPAIKPHGSHTKKHGPHTKKHGPHTKKHGPHTKKHGPHTKKHGPHAKIHGPHAKTHKSHTKTHGPHTPGARHTPGGPCSTTQNCRQGEKCSSKKCVPDTSVDCGNGKYHDGKQCVKGTAPSCQPNQEYVSGKCVAACISGLKRVGNKCVEDNTYECPEGTTRSSKGCVSPNGNGFRTFINPISLPNYGVPPVRFPNYPPEFRDFGNLLGSEITVLENNLNQFKNMKITVTDPYNSESYDEGGENSQSYGENEENSQWTNE